MLRPRLALALLLPLCFGFEWPGRLMHLKYDLAHGDTTRRREVVRALGGYAAADVRDALLAALEDDDPAVRLAAVSALGEVRAREAVSVLIGWANDKDASVRATVVSALGAIGDARAQATVVRALGDADASVRRAACAALQKLGGAEAAAPLLATLADPDADVRLAAVNALRGNADARAVSPLIARARDDAPEVRAAALSLLASLHDARALPVLVQGLADPAEDTRVAAAAALGELGDGSSSAVDALRAALAREPRVAKAALFALARIDQPAAQAQLVAALAQPELTASARVALVERVRRNGATGVSIVSDLAALLRTKPAREVVDTVADTLREIAPLVPIAPATDALIDALRSQTGDTADLAAALAATRSEAALVPLLEALEKIDDAGLPRVLDALMTAAGRDGEVDGRAADPLVARLTNSKGAARLAIVRALGGTRSPRVLSVLTPLMAAGDRTLRLAAIDAVGAVGGEGSGPALRALVSDRDAEVRDAAARALRAAATEQDVLEMLARVRSTEPSDRHAWLTAIGGALPRLARAGALHADTRTLALDTLHELIFSDDAALADRALDALRSFAAPESAAAIAKVWRMPSAHRRASAAMALSAFDGDETRKLLRYMLQTASPRNVLSIAVALGEVGDKRDAAALFKLMERKHWPAPSAVSFALARLAQRGELKKAASQRTLCAFAEAHEPYVRANLAAALAAMGAGACSEEISPLRWLEPRHEPAVRAAAAAWARGARDAGELDAAAAEAALRSCSADPDQSVSRACSDALAPAGAQPAASTSELDLYAYSPDGNTPLVDTLVALRLPGGAVFVGNTDANAHLRLRSVPSGELRLEDPAQAPLDP